MHNFARLSCIMMFIALVVPQGSSFADDASYRRQIRKLSYEEVIDNISTPYEAEKYLLTYLTFRPDDLNYGQKDYVASFRIIHQRGKDDCDGGALAAAALLYDDGYPPFMLCMYKMTDSKTRLGGHAVFIYHEGDKWGTLGIKGYDCRFPQFESIENIVRLYGYEKYNVKKIDSLYPDWIDNSINMHEKIYDPDDSIILKKEIEASAD